MAKKMTKAQMFKQIMDKYPLTTDEKAFIEHELELLSKKNSGDKKPTAQQEANATIKANILATMEADSNRLWTVSELLKAVEGLPEDMTNQRMSALVRQLVEANIVERTVDKRKAYFSLI